MKITIDVSLLSDKTKSWLELQDNLEQQIQNAIEHYALLQENGPQENILTILKRIEQKIDNVELRKGSARLIKQENVTTLQEHTANIDQNKSQNKDKAAEDLANALDFF
ncbi:hypothetical protein BHU72_09010 [Desulfuribacillus stibiiarsenatis]|uniref:Uncharacterized protein n=1 Tax=Desulfuribacillus stibiiarsenatis TaxID=1390249 RepID=A0A1E5L3A1_9FIRM|nr:hypothetical protein [Desulfuribacillus stibiiarsenatis]OEH84625.1 hypothetical protein BHU72_09010 [Desulfuribacillus stibiiarsenatis]